MSINTSCLVVIVLTLSLKTEVYSPPIQATISPLKVQACTLIAWVMTVVIILRTGFLLLRSLRFPQHNKKVLKSFSRQEHLKTHLSAVTNMNTQGETNRVLSITKHTTHIRGVICQQILRLTLSTAKPLFPISFTSLIRA